jgi:hypothetical protein
MKQVLFSILTLMTCNFSYGKDFSDYSFSQERMLTTNEAIFIVSSFEESDLVTAYSHYGDFLWETPFFAKILSWNVVDEKVFVFSKHRNGTKTYLTCLNRYTGKKIWQK